MRTSFHHQPEAQHPKSSAINKPAGRLPHLLAQSRHELVHCTCPLLGVKRTSRLRAVMSANDPKRTLGLSGRSSLGRAANLGREASATLKLVSQPAAQSS